METPSLAEKHEHKPQERQIWLLKQIINLFFFLAGIVSVVLIFMAALNDFEPVMTSLGVSMLLAVPALWWARRSLAQQHYRGAVLGVLLALQGLGLVMVGLLNNGLTSFCLLYMLSLVIIGLGMPPRAILRGTILLTGLLGVVSVIDYLGILNDVRQDSNILIGLILATTVTLAFGVIGSILYIVMSDFSGSLAEAQAQRSKAEGTRAEIERTLKTVQEQANEQKRLLELVRDLETPSIPVLPGVLAVPIVGNLDTRRLSDLTDELLHRLASSHGHTVIIDLTGVSIIDTAVANHLHQLIQAVRLLGAECIITGIRSEVAQTLVALGVDWSTIATEASLEQAIARLSATQALR